MSGPPEPAGQARCSICDRQINSHLCYVHEETRRGAELRMEAKLKATRRKGGRKGGQDRNRIEIG